MAPVQNSFSSFSSLLNSKLFSFAAIFVLGFLSGLQFNSTQFSFFPESLPLRSASLADCNLSQRLGAFFPLDELLLSSPTLSSVVDISSSSSASSSSSSSADPVPGHSFSSFRFPSSSSSFSSVDKDVNVSAYLSALLLHTSDNDEASHIASVGSRHASDSSLVHVSISARSLSKLAQDLAATMASTRLELDREYAPLRTLMMNKVEEMAGRPHTYDERKYIITRRRIDRLLARSSIVREYAHLVISLLEILFPALPIDARDPAVHYGGGYSNNKYYNYDYDENDNNNDNHNIDNKNNTGNNFIAAPLSPKRKFSTSQLSPDEKYHSSFEQAALDYIANDTDAMAANYERVIESIVVESSQAVQKHDNRSVDKSSHISLFNAIPSYPLPFSRLLQHDENPVSEGDSADELRTLDRVPSNLAFRVDTRDYTMRVSGDSLVISFVLQYYDHIDNIDALIAAYWYCALNCPHLRALSGSHSTDVGAALVHRSEMIVCVDDSHVASSRAWLIWRRWMRRTGGWLRLLMTSDAHEIRSYNDVAKFAKGRYLAFVQDDEPPCVPERFRTHWTQEYVVSDDKATAAAEIELDKQITSMISNQDTNQDHACNCDWVTNVLLAFTAHSRIAIMGLKNSAPLAFGSPGRDPSGVMYRDPITGVRMQYTGVVNIGPLIARRFAFLDIGSFFMPTSQRVSWV